MLKTQKYIIGILGTLIFHLILLNLFFILKITDKDNPHKKMNQIIIEMEEPQVDESEITEDESNMEDYSNIARNMNEEMPDELKNTRHARRIYELMEAEKKLYQDVSESQASQSNKSKEEIIKKALGEEYEKYLQDKKQIEGSKTEEIDVPQEMQIQETDNNDMAEEKKVIVEGPTTISYKLENRNDTYMPVPVYKCEGGGKIVVDIYVRQDGRVFRAIINKQKSKSMTSCLVEAALEAANNSRFNVDTEADPEQKGEIIYTFIPQ